MRMAGIGVGSKIVKVENSLMAASQSESRTST